jgi:hypothetical protein
MNEGTNANARGELIWKKNKKKQFLSTDYAMNTSLERIERIRIAESMG